jgi:hypothetical protein
MTWVLDSLELAGGSAEDVIRHPLLFDTISKS